MLLFEDDVLIYIENPVDSTDNTKTYANSSHEL